MNKPLQVYQLAVNCCYKNLINRTHPAFLFYEAKQKVINTYTAFLLNATQEIARTDKLLNVIKFKFNFCADHISKHKVKTPLVIPHQNLESKENSSTRHFILDLVKVKIQLQFIKSSEMCL